MVKTLNAFIGVYFAAVIALQYNDPDPYLWIAIYGVGLMFCIGIQLFRWLPLRFLRAFTAFCVGSTFFLLSNTVRWDEPLFIQETFREALGLVFLWCVILIQRTISEYGRI